MVWWLWQWHQLDHVQIICTSLQTDNHASTSALDFLQVFLTPNQQCQSTEGKLCIMVISNKFFCGNTSLLLNIISLPA